MPQGSGNSDGNGTQRVVDFEEVRAQRMDEKRRKTERIFFKHLLGVYTVTGHDKMRPIELIDVSADGCQLQAPFDPQDPWPVDAKDIPLRLYFSQDTYLPILVKVQNSRPTIQDGRRYIRYGCSVDKSVSSYEAYKQFVLFLKAYSEQAHKDNGSMTVFYL